MWTCKMYAIQFLDIIFPMYCVVIWIPQNYLQLKNFEWTHDFHQLSWCERSDVSLAVLEIGSHLLICYQYYFIVNATLIILILTYIKCYFCSQNVFYPFQENHASCLLYKSFMSNMCHTESDIVLWSCINSVLYKTIIFTICVWLSNLT